jgi:hypothetical protein
MIEVVLSHLHSDKPSLKACSLVCKAWTYPARLQLFSELTTRLTDDAESPVRGAAMFPFVRRLNVENQRNSWHTLLPQLVGLKRITSLRLSNIAVDHENSRALSAPSDLSRVATLHLEGVFFIDMTAFAQFVCAFPYLQTLSIVGSLNSDEVRHELPRSNAFCPSPNLVALELNFVQIAVLLEWFLSLPAHPAFRSVCPHEIWDSDLDLVDKFLAALGNSLEYLSFSAHFDDGEFFFRSRHCIHDH